MPCIFPATFSGPSIEILVHLILGLQVFATGAPAACQSACRLPLASCAAGWPVILEPALAAWLKHACLAPPALLCHSAQSPRPTLPLPSSLPLLAVLAILAELARPTSILAASLRPWLTMLQGAWWMQTAYIMCVRGVGWLSWMGSCL